MSIENTANILFDGNVILSNTVTTNVDFPLAISKSANYQSVIAGQTLTYTIIIENPNDYIVTDISFTDNFDSTKTSYVDGSFKVDGIVTVPDTTNPLTYIIPNISASASITLEFSVIVL